jgi:hypothetical protein
VDGAGAQVHHVHGVAQGRPGPTARQPVLCHWALAFARNAAHARRRGRPSAWTTQFWQVRVDAVGLVPVLTTAEVRIPDSARPMNRLDWRNKIEKMDVCPGCDA